MDIPTVCEYLIRLWCGLIFKIIYHNTHIHYAIINGHQDTVELFIEKDCNLQM